MLHASLNIEQSTGFPPPHVPPWQASPSVHSSPSSHACPLLAGWALHVTLDVVGRWPVPVLWPLSETRWALYRLDRDFSLTLDLVLIVGLAATLWDPAQRHARPIAIGTGLVLCFWLAAGLPT